MGIGLNALQFLELAHRSGANLSRTLMLGRQGMHITKPSARRFYRSINAPAKAGAIDATLPWSYAEAFLQKLYGAGTVDSMDASNYEQATIIHDLNTPCALREPYSFVLDAGCTEHVFNLPVALENIANLTAIGGHIAHAVPANNYMGHGFYQFSPELFFNLYTAERGFADTRVFLVEVSAPNQWYEVASPQSLKARVDVVNSCDLEMFVLARKIAPATSVLLSPPLQSDYQATWQAGEAPVQDWRIGVRQRMKSWLDLIGITEWVRSKKNSFPLRLMWRQARLSARRKDMSKFDIRAELRRA